jgi:hypothetical protein
VFHTKKNFFEVYMIALAWGGEYRWQAAALNQERKLLCAAEPFRFTKADTHPTEKPPKDKDPSEEGGEGDMFDDDDHGGGGLNMA